jgi:RimJ/RimL family protein N-acetyltransferase
MTGTIPPAVSFLPATGDDLPRLNELVNMPEIARFLNLIPPVPMESTLAFWDQVRAGKFQVWSIWERDRIVGSAGLNPCQPGTKLAHVTAFFIYVEPQFWGSGIADLAMDHLEESARRQGFARMECQAASMNARALRLYERHGFLREGVKRDAFQSDDQLCDLVVMGKLIRN